MTSNVEQFLAERSALLERIGMTETVSQYLARTEHLVDPDPFAGTDYEEIAR